MHALTSLFTHFWVNLPKLNIQISITHVQSTQYTSCDAEDETTKGGNEEGRRMRNLIKLSFEPSMSFRWNIFLCERHTNIERECGKNQKWYNESVCSLHCKRNCGICGCDIVNQNIFTHVHYLMEQNSLHNKSLSRKSSYDQKDLFVWHVYIVQCTVYTIHTHLYSRAMEEKLEKRIIDNQINERHGKLMIANKRHLQSNEVERFFILFLLYFQCIKSLDSMRTVLSWP